MKKLKNLSGLTLTELILVVIIVGILVSFGIPKYQKVIKQAKEKDAIVNLRMIKAAQNIYRVEVGWYFPKAGGIDDPADADKINAGLKLGLLSGDVTYSCKGGDAVSFNCTAGGTSSGVAWAYSITPALDVPTCTTGNCSY